LFNLMEIPVPDPLLEEYEEGRFDENFSFRRDWVDEMKGGRMRGGGRGIDFQTLSNHEKSVILQTLRERRGMGKFEPIYPSSSSLDYERFFQEERPVNQLLSRFFFHLQSIKSNALPDDEPESKERDIEDSSSIKESRKKKKKKKKK